MIEANISSASNIIFGFKGEGGKQESQLVDYKLNTYKCQKEEINVDAIEYLYAFNDGESEDDLSIYLKDDNTIKLISSAYTDMIIDSPDDLYLKTQLYIGGTNRNYNSTFGGSIIC